MEEVFNIQELQSIKLLYNLKTSKDDNNFINIHFNNVFISKYV